MEETIRITREDGVAVITLNRPQVYNAFNNQMSKELLNALRDVARDSGVRCVVLTGAGKAFCSGQDLGDRSDPNIENFSLGDSVRGRYNPLIRAIVEMEKPVLGAINGVAAGAGCSLALACDLRIVSDRARFIEAFVRVGLAPDSGSSYFLPKLVGLGRAMELAITGREVSAQEAVQIGLANRLVPHERFWEETLAWARQLAEGPTRAIGLIKRALYKGADAALKEVLEYEAYMQELAGRTLDFREGVSAFMEKRRPRFQGE